MTEPRSQDDPENSAAISQARSFADLGVSKPVVAALAERGVEVAFPIQEAVIEAALAGRDICGKAPTGSGKTLAFGLPAVDLAPPGGPWAPTVLILSPTRELASQIKEELGALAASRSRRIETVFGGTNIERDIKRLERGVDILVACPGRLEDLISRRCVELRDAGLVVVDEADRMADMGFLPSVKRILDLTPDNRHTMLFSATLDGDVDALISRYQTNPLTFEVDEAVETPGEVEHSWHLVESNNRIDVATEILRRHYSSIVFCRTRRGCDRVTKLLKKRGLAAVAIHGDRSQSQREKALLDFTTGAAQVLVATDVAARGIHVDDVELVLHYDPAGTDKDHVHRSGRTGRAGRTGRVMSLVVDDKAKVARQLQKDLGVERGFTAIDFDQFPDPAVADQVIAERANQAKAAATAKADSRRDGGRQANKRRQGHSKPRQGRNRSGDDRGGPRQKKRGQARGQGGGSRDGRSRDDRDRQGQARGQDGRQDGPRQKKRGQASGQGGGSRDGRDRDRQGQARRPDRGPGGQNRNSRDRQGQRRGQGGQGRSSHDRNGRPSNGGQGGRDQPRRRRNSNDWYPPDWEDEREQGPSGGSNTEQRKPRASKGRHADRDARRSRGKRRGPRRG